MTGALNGAVTVTLLSLPPNVVRSLDIFVTKSGDVLRTEGLPTRTPVPGAPPGEFTVHVDLDITGGWGKYEGAYGTIEYDGLGHSGAVPPTADYVYKGTVCGPNIKSDALNVPSSQVQSPTLGVSGVSFSALLDDRVGRIPWPWSEQVERTETWAGLFRASMLD